MKKPQLVLTTICSAIEYLVDRGEIEHITKVETKVRYVHPAPPLDEFIVTVGRKRIRVTAQEI